MRPVPQRFAQLVFRELGAIEVAIRDVGADAPSRSELSSAFDALDEARTLVVAIGEGRELVALFADEMTDRETASRRLEMLVGSFRTMLDAADDEERQRPLPEHILHAELRLLADEAGALDAVVIDAQSPVVWGDARSESAEPHVVEDIENVIPLPGVELERPAESWRPRPGVRDVVEAVRALPQLESLHRGGSLHQHGHHGEWSYVLRSFASIYVLVVVFERTPDELRVERAIVAHLPRVERAVLALPPLEPEPAGGAGALRRRR